MVFSPHLAICLAVVTVLAILNLIRSSENLWVAGGRGLGVLIHGALFYFVPVARQRMIRRERIRMEVRGRR